MRSGKTAVLSDQQVKEIYDNVYNSFWNRYKNRVPAWRSQGWEEIVRYEKQLRARYKNCPMVLHMVQDLMDQLEARSREKYDEEKERKASYFYLQ